MAIRLPDVKYTMHYGMHVVEDRDKEGNNARRDG